MQLLHGPVYAKEALEQRSDTIELFARRGSILDRDGNVMVRSLPSESVYAVPSQISDPDAVAAKLQGLFGRLDAGTVTALHDKRMQFVWVARKIPHDEAVKAGQIDADGIKLKEEDTGRRIDMVGRLASTVLGFVGIDENGLDGIEYAQDTLLRGSSGRMTLEEDEFGRPLPFGQQRILKAARPGMDLQLTLDPYLQYIAENALASAVHDWHARDGSALVMDPNTGALLAVANVPDYDPNDFAKASPDARRDRAIMDAYEPGSTFKLVTAAAAIESGKVDLRSRFPAHDELQVGGTTIHNAEDGFMANQGSSETLEQIVAYSHNVGAAEVGMSIGARTFDAMLRAAEFGQPTGVGLPGENPGIVPPLDEWSGSSLATMSFGQGVSVTPLELARFYCAIANGGLLLRPHIVQAELDLNGNVVHATQPKVERRIFSARTAATLREFLRAVVLRGTGNPTAQVAGYTTAGKTGTAQIPENGGYATGQYIASFVGFIPAERPRFVILVKVSQPRGAIYGSVVAAPVFAVIAKEAMLHAGVMPAPSPAPARLVRREAATK